MSVNDLVTVIVALAAVVVSIVALVISSAVDKRATRSALTDLAVKISNEAMAYEEQTGKIEADKAKADYVRSREENDHFARMKEIEMLVGQADFLVDRIKPGFFTRRIPQLARRPRYPPSVAVTLAQALESVNDPWWADRYWAISVQMGDYHIRALTYQYWGIALCGRLEFQRARKAIDEGLGLVTSEAADECIFRGDICAAMIRFDQGKAGCWRTAALDQYGKVSENDALYYVAEDRIKRIDLALLSHELGTDSCTFCVIASAPRGDAGPRVTEDVNLLSDWPCRRIGRLHH